MSMMIDDWSRVLFVGWGDDGGVSHYRTIVPARSIGASWTVIDMEGKMRFSGGPDGRPAPEHDVIVVQNCWNDWQLKHVQSMKEKGYTVLMNIDDWIKGIGKMTGSHGFSEFFGKKNVIDLHYRILRIADGVIASTEWLRNKLAMLNDNAWTARNILDLKRYDVHVAPEKDRGIIVGWAGGTGHRDALRSVLGALEATLDEHENVEVALLGDEMGHMFDARYKGRVHELPWSDMRIYPEYMKCFDIIIAPAMNNDFYRGKSQLRFYEGAACSIPVVASPMYDEIEHGVTGFIANTSDEWQQGLDLLIRDERVRVEMGAAARRYVELNVGEESCRVSEWRDAIRGLCRE